MAKKSAVEKNLRRRRMVDKYAARRAELRAIVHDRTRPPEERFEAAFPAPEGGGAEVVVRATDADGNRASFAVPVEKP